MEQGDLEEAIGAAQAVGDDRLQMQAQGRVVPESFTHGHRRAARALVRGRLFDRRPEALRHPRPGAP